MKKTVLAKVIFKALMKTGFPLAMASLVLGVLAFYKFNPSSTIELGNFLIVMSVILFFVWLLLVTSWLLVKLLNRGFARLPKVKSAFKPGAHYPDADATLVLPTNDLVNNNTTVAIYECSEMEDLIGLGYVEKQREDDCVEIVSYSIVPRKENDVWDRIQSGNKGTLKNIILKLLIPWQHISLNYADLENAGVKTLIAESSEVTQDGDEVKV